MSGKEMMLLIESINVVYFQRQIPAIQKQKKLSDSEGKVLVDFGSILDTGLGGHLYL